MFAAAHIIFNSIESPTALAALLAVLRNDTRYPCFLTECTGYKVIVPQIRVECAMPFLLQIEDDPKYVPAEIQEFAELARETFDADTVSRIQACRARVAAVSITPSPILETADRIVVLAQSDLDPENTEVIQHRSASAV